MLRTTEDTISPGHTWDRTVLDKSDLHPSIPLLLLHQPKKSSLEGL